jgi:hypothetical protein
MKRPQQVFANTDSLWAFYNFVTNALQSSHPKTWMEDQRILHYFISTIGNFQQCSTPAQVVQPINTVSTPIEDPLASNYGEPENQTNLLVQIAEVTGDDSVLEPAYPLENEVEELANEIEKVTTQAIKDDMMFGVSGVAVSEDGLRNMPIDEVLEKMQEADNQVVQEEDNCADDLHQSEEVVEDVIEDIELPFDIDADDDAVLDAILTPIEHKAENPIVDTGDSVKYTDPVGNVFEAPIVIDTIELNENTKMAVVVTESEFAMEDNFDLDFNETEEAGDDIPDFF